MAVATSASDRLRIHRAGANDRLTESRLRNIWTRDYEAVASHLQTRRIPKNTAVRTCVRKDKPAREAWVAIECVSRAEYKDSLGPFLEDLQSIKLTIDRQSTHIRTPAGLTCS